MGFWEVWYSTTDKLKQNAPTAVTNACRSCYDMGSVAFRKIDNAVNDGAQKLKDYLSGSQRRKKIGQIVTTIVKYEADVAARTFLKRGTGGLHVYNLVRNELLYLLPSNHGSRNSKCSKEMMEEMKREMMEEMQEQMDKMHEVIEKKMEEMEKKMDKMQEEINNINYHNKIILELTKQCESPGGNISLRISTKAPDLGTLICSQPARCHCQPITDVSFHHTPPPSNSEPAHFDYHHQLQCCCTASALLPPCPELQTNNPSPPKSSTTALFLFSSLFFFFEVSAAPPSCVLKHLSA